MRLTKFMPFGRWSLLFLFLAGMSKPGLGQAQTVGKWSTLSYTMPINPIHVALLYNGKILVVAGSGNCPASQPGCPTGSPYGPANNSGALLLDPTNGNITQFSVSSDMFCNGMVVLQDGRAFINGGTLAYDPFLGSLKSTVFDPATNTFDDVQNMAHGRWYPTVLTLGDGRVMTFSGFLETGTNTNTTVEFYTVGSGWSQPFTAPFTPDLYPRLHLLPNGKVFYSGPSPVSQLFDPSTTTWTLNVATTNYGGTRSYGSSVLLGLTPANNYDPVILIMGGNSPATATTETIDMGAPNPTWQSGPSMSQARIEMNAVILPSGKVLALGGSVNDEDASTQSLNADLYDPATNTFSSAGANSFARLYHSVALLLPDATVWVAGGNPVRGTYERHIEIYQPAYLFQSDGTPAARPSITSVPGSVSYGNQFTLQTPDAASIASAVLVRNGTVTHSFGMDQRMVGMSFTAGSGSLTVTAPPNANIAPPGYYMLFILNNNGVPSVASSILLSSSSTPAPTVTSISPNSGTINGGTAVTITGTGFLAGATVSVGGTAATGVTVVNSTSITATTPAHAAGAVNVIVTNSDTQSGTLTQGFTYTTGSNPRTDADRGLARVGNGRRWYGGDHNGHGIPGGSDGEPGRNTSHRCDGGEQHVDYSHHSGARGRDRKRDRDQQRYAERNVDPRIHLHGSIQSDTDADRDFARVGNGRRWYSGDHNGHGIPGGSDGEPGRDTSHGCDGGEQHVDYSHHSGACRGYGGRCRIKRRTTCRHAAQWLYLYSDRELGSRCSLGEFKFGHCSCRTNRYLHAVYRRRRTEWDSVTQLHWLADRRKLFGTR